MSAGDLDPAHTQSATLTIPFSDPLFGLLPPDDQALFRKPFTSVVRAGQFLGKGRNTSYKAAKAGQIPTIGIGGQEAVSTAWLWETWRKGVTAARQRIAA